MDGFNYATCVGAWLKKAMPIDTKIVQKLAAEDEKLKRLWDSMSGTKNLSAMQSRRTCWRVETEAAVCVSRTPEKFWP